MEAVERKLREEIKDSSKVIEACFEWIDAVPENVELPTMPGFSRDWAEGVLERLKIRNLES